RPESPRAAIHGARLVGATPGRPFLFRVPATGAGPLHWQARGLPEGLSMDGATGLITGTLAAAGTWDVTLTVAGAQGGSERGLRIVGGEHALALTPPLGWNSWNAWGSDVDAAKVSAAAAAMESSGLAAHGYRFVNIDDGWEAGRDAQGAIVPNGKFPDMPALAAGLHARGLLLGIYSSPGPRTCAGFEGSLGHEAQDAATWAAWGVDYLKYDWCSYSGVARDGSLAECRRPYELMRAALDAAPRDIVFSLCQYGMGDVWTWGADVGGNLWRTTGDITDSWASMSGIGFAQDGRSPFAGPGHWNDPDMLVVGRVGWGPQLRDSRLSPHEQITHMTLWALLAAPLLIGCDMTQLDAFTRALLTNDDVLDVDQDPLGIPARRVAWGGVSETERGGGRRVPGVGASTEVWARPLFDGSLAVGLFNRGPASAPVTVTWELLGLEGAQPVRNCWLARDEGRHDGGFTAEVPRHGALLLIVGRQPAAP
ncbi:MAG TPA: putative Ig domain-containing protein, partial [Planctomycetota bacterium]|nr:putative Ig domain-containing protein [Planctomycetota bacterium]